MDAIIYRAFPHKQINGTLFYAFEYYVFIKERHPDFKYIILNIDSLDFIKSVLIDKYDFDHRYLDDIIMAGPIDIHRMNIKNVLMLDLRGYNEIKPFLYKSKSVRIYSNHEQNYLNDKHTFYGFYDYQHFHKKTRLKFYPEIHKVFNPKGDIIFLSTLSGNKQKICDELGLVDPMIKMMNDHYFNLFARIGKIIYYHNDTRDDNNRMVVEAYIHDIPLEVYYNGYTDDSVYERTQELEKNGLSDFIISEDDILINDFLKDCGYVTNCSD